MFWNGLLLFIYGLLKLADLFLSALGGIFHSFRNFAQVKLSLWKQLILLIANLGIMQAVATWKLCRWI